MSGNRQPDLLSDVRQCVSFFSGLWGVFASLTLLLPLTNALAQVLPAHETQVPIYTALTTLTCCFAIFYIYITRNDQVTARLVNPARHDRQIIAVFAVGFCAALLYLIAHYWYDQTLEGGPQASVIEHGAAWVVGILLYNTSFTGLTVSFTLLAIVEYSKRCGETEELTARLRESLEAENQRLRQQLADQQTYLDRLHKRLTLYEKEHKTGEQ